MNIGDELAQHEIDGADSGEPFVRRADGSIIHLARVVTMPEQSSIAGAPDLVYFVGLFPKWLEPLAERDEYLVGVFVEIEAARFIYLGLGRVVAIRWRLGVPELIGFQVEAPLPDAFIDRLAPELRLQNE